MNKNYLLSKFKSTGTTYLLWFFFGCHYAYLGMWLWQLLYWTAIICGFFTFGLTWIWCFIDLFLIPGKVKRYNLSISNQIDVIERREKEEEFQRNIALSKSINSKTD